MAMRDQHVLGVPAGDNVVRLLPPLIITEADAADAMRRLEAACLSLEAKAGKPAA